MHSSSQLSFLTENEYFGNKSIQNVRKIINLLNVSKALVVTGKDSYITSGAEHYLKKELINCDCIFVNDFEVNPKYEDMSRIGRTLKDSSFDIIIAIGGGSVIDFAKCLNVYICTINNTGMDGITDKSLLDTSYLPMIAIPTTAGTGSEATHFAVAYIMGRKVSIAHQGLKPSYVILDPRFTYNLPKYITACSCFDALCQAIESFWSIGATPESQKFASEAIQIIKINAFQAINGQSPLARNNLLLGAFLAGKAINISKTTAPHALSYPLTSHFGIPHGHAVAMTLGIFFDLNEAPDISLNSSASLTLKEHKNRMLHLRSLLEFNEESSVQEQWKKFLSECGLNDKPSSNFSGLVPDDLLCNINIERLSNHPVKHTNDILENIYKNLLEIN